ncbi:MAG: hypothetical protein J5374_02900 [Bacteroidales bacterium]|nr:hypothetical protein [Bacteroidales bacterium]
MTRAFCVAGHTFHLEMPDGSPAWDLLSQYRDFTADPVDTPLFVLRTVEELPELEKEPLLVPGSREEGEPRLDLYSCGEDFLVEMAPLASLPVSSRLLMSGDYRRASLLFLKGSGQSMLFALNNALMLLYAFSSAPYMTLEVHASVIGNGGKGYLFLGKSGTGKSTHSSLWLKYIEGSELMNDDNPILRVGDDGVARVYGSPWSGKTPCYRNVCAPVGAIVRIRQAKHNTLTRQNTLESYASLYSSCSGFKADRKISDGQHKALEHIALNVPCFWMDCLPDADAARVCAAGVRKEDDDA